MNVMSPPQPVQITAKELIQDPQVRQTLRNLKPYQIMDFSVRYPQLIRQKDTDYIKKELTYMFGVQIVSLITGVILNIKLKSFYPSILTQPWYMRYGTRFVVLTAPMLLGYQLAIKPQREKLNVFLESLYQRLVTLGVDGNLEVYNAQ